LRGDCLLARGLTGEAAIAWSVVRDGLPRIAFAGEHTESLAGFMESAVRSGHRVAARLSAAAGLRTPTSAQAPSTVASAN
jgi:hypothetical protein